MVSVIRSKSSSIKGILGGATSWPTSCRRRMSLGVLSYMISLEVMFLVSHFPKNMVTSKSISPCQTSIFRFSCFNRWSHCTLWKRLVSTICYYYCMLIIKPWICLVCLEGKKNVFKALKSAEGGILDRHASSSHDHSPSLKVIFVPKSNHTFTVMAADQKALLFGAADSMTEVFANLKKKCCQ